VRIRSTAAVVLVLFAATAFLASCSNSGRVICDYAQDAGTFVGPLVRLRGANATFFVEQVKPNSSPAASALPRQPSRRLVVVRYEQKEQQYLHVGRRYSVRVWAINGFFSSVHVAGHKCSGGTVYANGSAIDTSVWSRPRTRHLILVLVSVVLLVLGGAALFARARRRRTNVDEPGFARDE
jgi:hypothetical protein